MLMVLEERDGGIFAGDVRVFACTADGRLSSETRKALRLYDERLRLHTCRVCSRRFIGHHSRHGCSDECRKVVAQRALEKHRRPRRIKPEPKPARPRLSQCSNCWKQFEYKRDSRDYCSNACRQAEYRSRKAA